MESRQSGGCCLRMKRELQWQSLWLVEKNPEKFATSAWIRSQYPFLVYRIVCFVYSASILTWGCYQASQLSTEHLVAEWFLAYPTWSFMIFTIYNTFALLLTGFNFNDDCLCNDDLSWYHKVCWVFHVVSFNSAVSCLFGSLIHIICEATNDTNGMTYTEVFRSADINYYIIGAVVMMVDVFIHNISVRFLHFVYSSGVFVFYSVFHVYRWAAGYVPTHSIFAFSSVPAVMPSFFILFVIIIYVPAIHLIAYGIDYLRKRLLVKMWSRQRHDRLCTANAFIPSTTSTRATLRTPTPPTISTAGELAESKQNLGLFHDGYDGTLQPSSKLTSKEEHYPMKKICT